MTDRAELRRAEQESVKYTLVGRWAYEHLPKWDIPIALAGFVIMLAGLIFRPLFIIGATLVAVGALTYLSTVIVLVVLENRIADADRRRGIRWNGTTYDDISDKEQL